MSEEKKDTKKEVIKKKTKVTVSNTLNQMIFEQKDMNLQAFRMVMFYLAKINPKRPDLTTVKVPLETYAEILGVELNEQAIDASTELLMGYRLKVGEVIEGEYRVKNAKYNIFSVCRLLERMSDGKRMLEFKCTDDIKPMIFELQEKFTKFNVWNVLNLSNFQDIRMYMLLSQYKVAKSKTFKLDELKEKLGIDKEAYPEYKIFARAVLKKCQKSLGDRTDIKFEFKSIGRPAHSVCFDIEENENYKILKYLEEPKEQAPASDPDQLTIDDWSEDMETVLQEKREQREEICYGLSEKIFDEFSDDQLRELVKFALEKVSESRVAKIDMDARYLSRKEAMELNASRYIEEKILYVNVRGAKSNRYSYILKAVKNDYQ